MRVESPFGTSVDGKCSCCHKDLDGSDWPDDTNGLLCQMCWESACSKSWWDAVNSFALINKPGGDVKYIITTSPDTVDEATQKLWDLYYESKESKP